MFGTKLRTWMEAHIVRSKKKKDRKKGEKGFDSNCNSPRNRSANRSPCLHQVHPAESPEKAVDGIRLHGGGSYATASASSGTSAGTGSVNLSSPESAYSTGYSTDGTSPGTSFPPEYYINIRTGTHYFQSTGNNGRPNKSSGPRVGELPSGGAPGPGPGSGPGVRPGPVLGPGASPAPGPGPALLARHGILEAAACLASMTRNENRSRDGRGTNNASSKISEESREEQSQRARAQQDRYHRRTESFSGDSTKSNLAVPSSIPPPLVVSPSVQSPRERSRIRTNPWLSANSSGSSNAGFKSRLNLDDASSGSALKLTESSGSASDVNVNCAREARAKRELKQESLSAGRSPINQNWRIASGLEIRSKMALSMQRRSNSSSSSSTSSSGDGGGGGGSSNGNCRSNSGCSGSSDCNGNGLENEIVNTIGKGHGHGHGHGHGNRNCNGSSTSSVTRSARSSEDDITLNEMMGKFDESYVYEKETDILSDSDPTDCEDCIDSLSDVDAARIGAEDNDPLDNTEFDYIDNGSFLDLDNLDCSGRFPNTGHCTYFAFTSELARRSDKLRESLTKRRTKEDANAVLQRMASAKNVSAKRPSASRGHGKKTEEKQQSEKRKKRASQRRKSATADRCDDETANLNRALLERMLLKNSGFNQQGSRSVGGTPICLRRKKHDLNKNLSPIRLNATERASVHPSSVDVGTGIGTGVDVGVDLDVVKRRSNSVSYVNGNVVGRRIGSAGSAYMTAFASEIALIEADKEADKKYRELILEAENILVTMQKSQNGGLPVVPSPTRKFHNGLANKRVELIKNTELNIELALSKSRNSQPELQSGSIRDLEHTSPKRQFAQPCSPVRRFVERNGPTASELRYRQEAAPPIKYFVGDSPIATRRTPPLHSPGKATFRSSRRESDAESDRRPESEADAETEAEARRRSQPVEGNELPRAPPLACNGFRRVPSSDSEPPPSTTVQPEARPQNRPRAVFPRRDGTNGTDAHPTRLSAKEEFILSSSSDSEDRCDIRRRPTLMTFRSVDMGPTKEGSFYCPQSEPVKRKVYAGSTTYGRIQKTLGEHVALRNSDGDTATDDTDDSRRSLKEKVAQLRRERLVAVDAQDSQILQQQMSQLRRQMLMHTIEGLKRSLEDQSATLKQTCLEPVMSDQMPPEKTKMKRMIVFYLFYACVSIVFSDAQDILGCGGFLKSHANIDFAKVQVKLYTKAGSLKDATECAPNNGYYFLPLYDKGEYILKVDPPRGWSFEPMEVLLNVDGTTDACSLGKDINFTFKGFGIAGRVIALGSDSGPKGVNIALYKEGSEQVPAETTFTAEGGTFYFTPIQPGKYVLVASHPTWVIEKDTVRVTVREGNTELADGSLVVFGYDVSGRVTSEEEPVSGVTFLLIGNGVAKNCATTAINKELRSRKPICHVVSDKTGKFVFPSVSPGDYKLVPYYAGGQTKFDVQPAELSFKVNHNSVALRPGFKVTGFTVSGFVRIAIDGDPLPGTKIFLSQKEVAVTDAAGKYVLDNMKAGQYSLKAEADNVLFIERLVKISPSSSELPVLSPSAYKVCGKVTLSAKETLHHRKVSAQNTANTFTKEIETDPKTGEFCIYLAPDRYLLSVVVTPEERDKGLQFFPLQQTIDVSSRPVNDVNFLQLKATLSGTVKCLPGTDCSQASVTLKVLDGITIKTIQAKVVFRSTDGQYKFTDVLPGHYELLIDNDVFCWENPSYRISVTSERAEVPTFIQTGFSVSFISSHDTTVVYSEPGDTTKLTLALNKGSTKHCVSKPGMYSFAPKGCHVYEQPFYAWDTNSLSPILLHSSEHSHKGSIQSASSLNPVKVNIKTLGDVVTLGPLKPVKEGNFYKYEFEFKAKTDNVYTITPLSDILLFSPPSLKVLAVNDCQNDVASFIGEMGKIIAGKINPPLEGVTVQIFGNDKTSPIHTLVTRNDGAYVVGPLDRKIDYSVTAEKDGYVITGPDSNGDFLAHKLAEIIVQVSDQADNVSLQGVLLSLSGGQSYRKNSVTGEDGRLVFNSLSPGEYYLRPMMKEYRFDPPSKMIKVMEGATVKVELYGKRVAFSAYGSVTSLNGKPEAGLLMEVQGQADCSNLQEEATTEENGNFRIRGLQPRCTYVFRLKPSAEANAHIQRTSPESILVQISEDIHGLRLIAFHPISRTDVSVHVVSAQPEHYRTLKVKLCREDMPDSPIHTGKLETQQLNKIGSNYNAGFLVHLPPLQADGRKYFVQLESSLSETMHKYRTLPFYFEANSSFKHVKLTFNAERKIDQNEMSQTSVIVLPFIMLVAFAFLNREKIWTWLSSSIERRSKPSVSSRTTIQAVPIDPRADDIIVEQIMSINKRKTKPRKT
ncbi:uncharacterized protein LOC117223312 [Megalopta genalis]|uniref:uncharacterized protein LOC117223312 n=1 Tax=Megalopta genalis TaxID=115081 RepID=UPI003FD0DE3C